MGFKTALIPMKEGGGPMTLTFILSQPRRRRKLTACRSPWGRPWMHWRQITTTYPKAVYFLPACLRFGSKKSGQNWKKLTVSPPPQSPPCIMTRNSLLSQRKPVCQKGTPVSKSETGAFFYHHSIPACFLRALNEVSLITCSILQASSVAVASSTPRVIRNCASKVCFS